MAKPSTKAQSKYNKKTYTQIQIRLKKEEAEKLKDYVLHNKESLNGYITRLIKEDMELTEMLKDEEFANATLKISD